MATNHHILHLVMKQLLFIWEHVVHTHGQAVSNTVTICCLTEDSPSSRGSVQRVLELIQEAFCCSWPCTLESHLLSLNKIASRAPPALQVHGHMPLRIILCYIVTTVGSQLFYSWREQGLLSIKWSKVKWSRSVCPTLCDPVDCIPPGSPIHGILQARILEWVAISFSRGSSQPRDRT